MKIEIEITEEVAACIWANRNPLRHRGKFLPVADCVQDMAEEEAAKFAAISPTAAQQALTEYRTRTAG